MESVLSPLKMGGDFSFLWCNNWIWDESCALGVGTLESLNAAAVALGERAATGELGWEGAPTEGLGWGAPLADGLN